MDRLVISPPTSVLGLLAAVALLGCSSKASSDEPNFGPEPVATVAPQLPDTAVNPRLLRRFRPLRAAYEQPDQPRSAALIDLGRALFFETRLSANGAHSCNTCHTLEHYGVDRQPISRGTHGDRGKRNSPSVFHAAGHFASFWDGRVATVEEQAGAPLLNPTEMAMRDKQAVVAVLASIPGYVTAFAAAFPGEAYPISFENVGRALGAFERGLATPSRWDRYLEGDSTALTSTEIKGLKLFTSLGCVTCHTGELLGGTSFQKVGLVELWPNQADQGRFEITKLEDDRMMFKVPSLRNVARTGPYFHDGSVPELATAVQMMAKYQLGIDLDPPHVADLVAWLEALTGKLPMTYIAKPDLPPNRLTTQAVARR